MKQSPVRPIPVPDSLSAPFWKSAEQGRLSIQRCLDCGHFHHPPVPQCQHCLSIRLGWQGVSGHGRIHEFTVMHEPLVEGFEAAVPYAVIIVEIAEEAGVFVVGNLIGVAPAAARVGLPVVVEFEELEDGTALPQFSCSPALEDRNAAP
jgi:uncharacterized protein